MKAYIKNIAAAIILAASMPFGLSAQADSTIVLRVSGAGCHNDIAIIVGAVKSAHGVKDASLDKHAAVSLVKVVFDPRETSYEKLAAVVESTGTCTDPNARRYKVRNK
jgi:hypothetical protein